MLLHFLFTLTLDYNTFKPHPEYTLYSTLYRFWTLSKLHFIYYMKPLIMMRNMFKESTIKKRFPYEDIL